MFYIYITIYSLNEEQYWIQQEKDRQYRSEAPSSIPLQTHLIQDTWKAENEFHMAEMLFMY